VLSLCDIYIQSHRLIAFDNFFTSYQLLKTINEKVFIPWVWLQEAESVSQIFWREKIGCSVENPCSVLCGNNKVAGQQTCDSSVHVLQSQASHFGETEEQRWYIIEYSLPRRSCRVHCNNGRSRSLRPETREICNWEALSGVPGGGVGGFKHPPPKFRSFDKAEPNSQFRGK
jgi:hypothetical protein